MKTELLEGYIKLKKGSSVSDQFIATFEGAEGMDEQNVNALKYILECCIEVRNSEVFGTWNDLNEYIENLNDYITNN